MKILIAPDSFKESLSALDVARNIETGIKRILPDVDCVLLPMADGGEGTVQSLVDATDGEIVHTKAHDPLMRIIDSFFGILGDGITAVIEMAAASGLELLNDKEKDPLYTTTYGTGELILAAIEKGCKKVIIGIGGSATNDGGMGMARAFGLRFLDKDEKEVSQGGKYLQQIAEIDRSDINISLEDVSFTIASDVTNHLCGPKGASQTFGPQKGASPEQVDLLDKGLRHYGILLEKMTGKSIMDVPGAGAAGGLGAGLVAFLNAEMKPGFKVVRDLSGLVEKMRSVDLVITGEGKIDFQTQYGKTPFGVAMEAKKLGIPVIAFAGTVEEDIHVIYNKGFDCILPILEKPMSLDLAIKRAPILLQNAAERMARLLLLAK